VQMPWSHVHMHPYEVSTAVFAQTMSWHSSIIKLVIMCALMQKSSLLISMTCVADGQEDMLKAAPAVNVEIREHFPAASSSQDTYTLLKFYNLSKDLIKTLLQVTCWFACPSFLPESSCMQYAMSTPQSAYRHASSQFYR